MPNFPYFKFDDWKDQVTEEEICAGLDAQSDYGRYSTVAELALPEVSEPLDFNVLKAFDMLAKALGLPVFRSPYNDKLMVRREIPLPERRQNVHKSLASEKYYEAKKRWEAEQAE